MHFIDKKCIRASIPSSLKFMSYAPTLTPTPKLVREKCEFTFCATFDVDNFSYSSFGEDLVKFPEIKLVGCDETWLLKLGLQNFGPLITFTIATKLQKTQDIRFYLSATLGGVNLLSLAPMIFANQVFTASYQIQGNYLNSNLSCGQKLTIQVQQIIKNFESSGEITKSSEINSNSSKLSTMLNNPEFSDFKFIVNEKEFNVHKCVLASTSEAFVKIFRVNKNFWKINDINEHIFDHILRFIYCEKVPENLGNIAVKLFEAADVFKIEELKEICSNKIHQTLSAENALETYKWAYVYDLEVLKMKSWELVKKHILKIDFPMKDEPLSPDLVQRILDQKKMEHDFWSGLKLDQ